MKCLIRSTATAAAVFIIINATHGAPVVFQSISPRKSVSYVGRATGVIKKIDIDQESITVKHGPIENLGMPDMTMIFRLAKPEQAAAFKVGDLVRFKVERINGSWVITEIMSLQ